MFEHKRYIGEDKRLQGKTALIQPFPEENIKGTANKVIAQFDDMDLPEAFNWWPFYDCEFEDLPEKDRVL